MLNQIKKQTLTFTLTSVAAVLSVVLLSGCGKTQSTESLLAEAKQYQQKGDNKAAIIQLKNALQKNPESIETRYLLGTIYNEVGDPVSAEKELRKAGYSTPLIADIHFNPVAAETAEGEAAAPAA